MNDYSNDDDYYPNNHQINQSSMLGHHYGNSMALLNNSSNFKKGAAKEDGRNTKMESRIESYGDFVDYMIPLSSMGGGVKN